MKYLQSLSSFIGIKNIFSDSFAVSLLFFCLIGFLLLIGRKINLAIKIARFGLPIAVICGLVGILIGPYGVINLFTEENTKIWERSLTPLLSLVFASLMLGRPIPNIKGLIKPILNQFLLAISLGFGQFFVGGLVVKYFLEPSMDVNPLMGCLIEVGFEGGHGAATILGNSFEKLAIERSTLLYNLIDNSDGFYRTFVTDPKYRSRMQVVFTIRTGKDKDMELVEQFLTECNDTLGWLDIRSHPLGLKSDVVRVTMYNHQTLDTIRVVRDYMINFMQKHK